MGKKRARGRQLILQTFEPERMDMEVPVRKYEIDAGSGRVFVFVLSAEDRRKISHLQVEEMAIQLGNLVHPHQAAFLVVQPSAELKVYEVKDPLHTPQNVKPTSGNGAAGRRGKATAAGAGNGAGEEAALRRGPDQDGDGRARRAS